MDTLEHSHPLKITGLRTIAGIVLILVGGVLFIDRYLKTGWLSLAIIPAVGLLLYLWGIRLRHPGMILAGGLIGGIGAGAMAAWGPAVQLIPGAVNVSGLHRSLVMQIGLLALYFGVGWGLVIITVTALTSKQMWWAMVPGGVFGALGCCLLFTPTGWTDFAFYLAVGIGLPLLVWGLITRLIGLVIPGCLLMTMGPGVFQAWGLPASGNGLTQTGIMLIWFAFGWVLMSVASRWVLHHSIWWPLIPGGILAVVGIGLYIGGDPSHALGFISNTGSIALMIFGLYLLLMRKGIHH